MANANFTMVWSVDNSSQESTSFTITDSGVIPVLDVNDLTTPVTNSQYVCAIDVSQLKCFVIVATEDCTLKANSSGSPDFTLTLKADKPLLWWENCGYTNLMTTDVTSFYLTCAATATDFDLTLRGIYDPTP